MNSNAAVLAPPDDESKAGPTQEDQDKSRDQIPIKSKEESKKPKLPKDSATITDHSGNSANALDLDEDDEGNETDPDDPDFIEKLGVERYITFAEFAKLLSVFNPKIGLDEKIKFYFRIFDINNDKKIDNEELLKFMK